MPASTAAALQGLLDEAAAALAKSAPRDAQGEANRRLGRVVVRLYRRNGGENERRCVCPTRQMTF